MTPTTLAEAHEWHGLEGITIVVLQRTNAAVPVEVLLEDETHAGAWLEWPAVSAGREVPGTWTPLSLLAFLIGGLLRCRGDAQERCPRSMPLS
jgi:hypothetical protein